MRFRTMTVNQYLNLLIVQYFSITDDLFFACFSIPLMIMENIVHSRKKRPWKLFSFQLAMLDFSKHFFYFWIDLPFFLVLVGTFQSLHLYTAALLDIAFFLLYFLCLKFACSLKINFGYSIYAHCWKNNLYVSSHAFFQYNNASTGMRMKTREKKMWCIKWLECER